MRKNKHIVLQNVLVENYAAEGKSLARVDGKVIFIEGAVPGDVADIRLRKNKKDWGEGSAIKFHSYSADRVIPFCQHFGVCGGCQWQMLPYERQLQYKQQQVYDSLQRIGKVPLPQMLPIIGAEQTTFYRNKLEYTFGTREFTTHPPAKIFEDADLQSPFFRRVGGALGFHAKGFFDKIVNIEKCWLQPEPTNAVRLTVRQYARENDLSFYNIREHYGFLRTMQVRICTTGEVMVNLVVAEKDEQRIEQLLQFLQRQFPAVTTWLYTINEKKNDSIHDLEPVVYSGKGYITEKIEDLAFKIGPKSFFQTNTSQAERLYQLTRNFAELSGKEVVYDLYCGTGSIGLFISRNTKKIIGVEVIPDAVADAKENAARNNIANAEFFTGDVTDVCDDDFFATNGRPDVIITDPPRAGMHEKLVNKILAVEAPLIVYVSCNPATQARDINLLAGKYRVTKIQPVDMFPHTLHIENIVQLKLN